MGNRDRIKSLGFDALISGLYFVIILISFILSYSLFDNQNYRASYSTCFILIVPCVLDGIKDFVNTKRKNWLDIIDAILTGILSIIAVLLLVLIFKNEDNKVFGEVLIWCSIIGVVKYAVPLGFSIIELIKEKKKTRED